MRAGETGTLLLLVALVLLRSCARVAAGRTGFRRARRRGRAGAAARLAAETALARAERRGRRVADAPVDLRTPLALDAGVT